MTSHAPAAPSQKKGASSDSRDMLLRPEETPMATREDHQATRDQSKQHIQAHDWSDGSSDFVLVQDVQPPPPYRVGARADADVSSVSWPDPDHKRRLRRGVCGPQR